jgi:hypothetical protein
MSKGIFEKRVRSGKSLPRAAPFSRNGNLLFAEEALQVARRPIGNSKTDLSSNKLKTSKKVLGSLRGLIGSFFDKPAFSFYSPEGWRFGFWSTQYGWEI